MSAAGHLTGVGLALAMICPMMAGIAGATLMIAAAWATRGRRNGGPPRD